MLPTLTYIGGPAEVAYPAPSAAVYDRLLGRMPVAMPRAGFTVLNERTDKLMERYQLSLKDLFHGPEPLRDRVAAARRTISEAQKRDRRDNEEGHRTS